jgi:hypothetical protein
MGHQIIRQPDGLLCVYSTIVGQIIVYDATPQELVDYYAQEAAERARRDTRKMIDAVLTGEQPYYQFTMTYDEAVADHLEHDGEPEIVRRPEGSGV